MLYWVNFCPPPFYVCKSSHCRRYLQKRQKPAMRATLSNSPLSTRHTGFGARCASPNHHARNRRRLDRAVCTIVYKLCYRHGIDILRRMNKKGISRSRPRDQEVLMRDQAYAYIQKKILSGDLQAGKAVSEL